MRLSFISSYLACFYLVFAAPVQATPAHLDVTVNFDLVKVSHDCVPTDVLPPLAPGECNYYQPLTLGQTYVGLDLSQFDAAPLIAFTATKEMNYVTETDG